MLYEETKVYYDGSHYIAIPHTENKTKRRPPPEEEYIAVEKEAEKTFSVGETKEPNKAETPRHSPVFESMDMEKPTRTMTRKQLFNELYAEYLYCRRDERRKKIIAAMLPYFKSEKETELYVDANLERKKRNLLCRRIRMMRKANLADFNYFVTLTYDDEKHTEESFRKALKNKLSLLSYRRGWKYMGVWERSPEKQRLHFHGLFHIPDGTMPGEMIEVSDYDFSTRRRRITHQNTYFNERFGRSDFSAIEEKAALGYALEYLLKYIEKTGERIVYSKGLPQFFVSDIMDDDVICRIGLEDKKLLLYDDFKCIDEGTVYGKVSKRTIGRMRKTNQ